MSEFGSRYDSTVPPAADSDGAPSGPPVDAAAFHIPDLEIEPVIPRAPRPMTLTEDEAPALLHLATDLDSVRAESYPPRSNSYRPTASSVPARVSSARVSAVASSASVRPLSAAPASPAPPPAWLVLVETKEAILTWFEDSALDPRWHVRLAPGLVLIGLSLVLTSIAQVYAALWGTTLSLGPIPTSWAAGGLLVAGLGWVALRAADR